MSPGVNAERAITVYLDGRARQITRGTLVLVWWPAVGGAYGAVVERVGALDIDLTFTPRNAPRRVSIADIASVHGNEGATLDPLQVTRIQPEPDRMPRRVRTK